MLKALVTFWDLGAYVTCWLYMLRREVIHQGSTRHEGLVLRASNCKIADAGAVVGASV